MSITHPDYEPVKIPLDRQEHLKQISLSDRDRYLAAKLQNYLYAIYSGSIKPKPDSVGEPSDNSESNPDREPMANYVNKWSKTKFYRQLTQHNHSQGYSDPNWQVVEREAENRWQISKNGLTLSIKPEKYLIDSSAELQIGQVVSIKMPPSLVDHGLYIAVGDSGSPSNSDLDRGCTIAQLYFNVSSAGALQLLERLTQELNLLKIPFDFKIAYDEADFDRLDATVLEFKSTDFARLQPMLNNVYQETQIYFQPEIPFFCKHLALLGLGVAEKPPLASDFEPENIGERHCGIIANALVAAWQQGDEAIADKLDYVLNCLTRAKININYLYLNPDSQDIYEALF